MVRANWNVYIITNCLRIATTRHLPFTARMTEYIWTRQISAPHRAVEHKSVVLVLYTGGTIGMQWSEDGYILVPDYFDSKLRTYPMLHDPDYKFTSDELKQMEPYRPLAMPHNSASVPNSQRRRVLYCVSEYNPLLDSSSMSMKDWGRIALDIEKHYASFDAFVILHGTDTMSYTASALSFMLENLGKTVVLTGAQVPLSELQSDGRDNLLGALLIAGNYTIPEVTLYFHTKLFRGNRTTKVNSASFEAFCSPNLPPLAATGVDIHVEWDAICRPNKTEKFKVHSSMNQNIGILRLFPGITRTTLSSFLQKPIEGVVLQTFGAGNFPEVPSYVLDELKRACSEGIIIVNCTQCAVGHVTELYPAGKVLRQAGVVPGADMTTEAALTKISYVLGKNEFDMAKRKDILTSNLCGELTVLDSGYCLRDSKLLLTLSSTLNLRSHKELQHLRHSLMPPLLCAAAVSGDLEALKELHSQGGDLNQRDYGWNTPLHMACTEGNLHIVQFLLEHGASVHARDKFGHTPLHHALVHRHNDVIKLLVQTGARVQWNGYEVAGEICQAAASDDVDTLLSWQLAGVTFADKEWLGQTPMKAAVANNAQKAVQFLTNTL